jgi:hypothetical protein
MTRTGTLRKRIRIAVNVTAILMFIEGVWLSVGRDLLSSNRRAKHIVALLEAGTESDISRAGALLLGYPNGLSGQRSQVLSNPLKSRDAERVKRAVLDALTRYSDPKQLWVLLYFPMESSTETGIAYNDQDWLVIEAAVKKYNAQRDEEFAWRVIRKEDGSRELMIPGPRSR